MTHLTKTTQHNLFETSVAPRPNRETRADKVHAAMPAVQRDAPFSVGVDLTPDEERRTIRAGWPEYDWPSVSNIPVRHRGKHY